MNRQQTLGRATSHAATRSLGRSLVVIGVAVLIAGAIWLYGRLTPDRALIKVGGEKYVVQKVVEPTIGQGDASDY